MLFFESQTQTLGNVLWPGTCGGVCYMSSMGFLKSDFWWMVMVARTMYPSFPLPFLCSLGSEIPVKTTHVPKTTAIRKPLTILILSIKSGSHCTLVWKGAHWNQVTMQQAKQRWYSCLTLEKSALFVKLSKCHEALSWRLEVLLVCMNCISNGIKPFQSRVALKDLILSNTYLKWHRPNNIPSVWKSILFHMPNILK